MEDTRSRRRGRNGRMRGAGIAGMDRGGGVARGEEETKIGVE